MKGDLNDNHCAKISSKSTMQKEKLNSMEFPTTRIKNVKIDFVLKRGWKEYNSRELVNPNPVNIEGLGPVPLTIGSERLQDFC
ncbi:901_t:CDS:2 [Funneliformis caledonium]|uniref:901_t:CDS:1 n=1 Tax=Funneliformis caledonium TaxID=1117310 RepID=A0A9N9GGP2_9GLOM|nr:901_t:CDS:2 [Funneliformis caledonium]